MVPLKEVPPKVEVPMEFLVEQPKKVATQTCGFAAVLISSFLSSPEKEYFDPIEVTLLETRKQQLYSKSINIIHHKICA